jgi:hypothetical protein
VDAAKRKILGFGGKMTYRLEGLNGVDGRKINIALLLPGAGMTFPNGR